MRSWWTITLRQFYNGSPFKLAHFGEGIVLDNFFFSHQRPLVLLPPPFPQAFTVFGNRELNPEELLSFEVGYQFLLFERIWGRIDLFYNQLDQQIISVPVFSQPFPDLPPLLVERHAMNVGGGEIGVNVIITSWLKAFLNYSYQELNKPFDLALSDIVDDFEAATRSKGYYCQGIFLDMHRLLAYKVANNSSKLAKGC